MSEPSVHVVSSDETVLAYVIRGGDLSETSFPLPAALPLQVGFVVYPAGGEVADMSTCRSNVISTRLVKCSW